MEPDVEELKQRLAAIEAQLRLLNERVQGLEARPATIEPPAAMEQAAAPPLASAIAPAQPVHHAAPPPEPAAPASPDSPKPIEDIQPVAAQAAVDAALESASAAQRQLHPPASKWDLLAPPKPGGPIRPESRQAPRPESPPGPRPLPRTPPPPRRPREPAAEPAWHDALRRIHMWPPERGSTAEAELGTWWLTRIGGLILVIGAVFFGVYVSQYSRPWVRLSELTIASLGLAVFGLWLERGAKEFGSVVLGCGLAMLFFTAYGAYAAPPLKVIDSAAAGAAWQFAAAGLIAAVALWRNAPSIASMAVLCGFVACYFSFVQGYNEFALGAAWVLAAGAGGLSLGKGWPVPLRLSLVPAYAMYASIVVHAWDRDGSAPGFAEGIAFPLATMLLFIASDFVAMRRKQPAGVWTRRIMMSLNTSLAIAFGLLATYLLYPADYDTFYFTFGLALLAVAGIYWRADPEDGMVYLFYIKGSALISMGFVSHFKGRTRWIALAVQSLVLLLSARRSRMKRAMSAVATATWLVSFGFFIYDLHGLLSRSLSLGVRPTFASLDGLRALGYLFFSTWLMCAKGRWLAPEGLPQSPFGKLPLRQLRLALYALLPGAGAIAAAYVFAPIHEGILAMALIAAGMAAVYFVGRHWAAAVAACVPFLAAHALLHFDFGPAAALESVRNRAAQLWPNALIVFGLTLATALAADRLARTWRDQDEGSIALRHGAGALHGLWMLALLTALFRTTPQGIVLLIAAAIAADAAGNFSRLWRGRRPLVAMLPLLVALQDLMQGPDQFGWGVMIAQLRDGVATLGASAAGSAWGAALAAPLAFALPALTARGLRISDKMPPGESDLWKLRTQTALVTLTGLAVMLAFTIQPDKNLERYWLIVALTCAGLAAAALTRWPGLPQGIWSGIFYLLVAHVAFNGDVEHYGLLASAPFIAVSVFAAAATLALAIAVRRLRPDLGPNLRIALEGGLCGLALAMSMLLFASQTGRLASWATVFWGVSAIAVFVAGLAARVKPLRVVSLIGLAACIGRIFAVDTHSALDRIFAFVGVGLTLMAVGFLYNKFKDRIEGLR